MSEKVLPKHHSGLYHFAIHSVLFVISVIFVVLAVVYTAGVYYFQSHFYPKTMVNGVSVGNMVLVSGGVFSLEQKCSCRIKILYYGLRTCFSL